MSTTIIAVIINLLAMVLPKIGVQIGTDELTNTAQVIVALVSGIWVWIQNNKLHKAIEVAGVSAPRTLGAKA